MAFDVVSTVLSAAVATSGTFTTGYPTGQTAGSYSGGYDHKMIVVGGGRVLQSPADFTIVFTSNTVLTVTYKGTTTLAAGTTVRLQLDKVGKYPWAKMVMLSGVNATSLDLVQVNLGSPAAGAANNLSTSAALLAATAAGATLLTLAGALDVPRNIVAAWTGTSVITVTGKDKDGTTIRESSGSGTSLAGKKAFASVSLVTVSADVTGLTVGTGNVIGIPVYVPQIANVLQEMQDGSKPTAGTIVAAVSSAATATTGDIRGTYTPNATPDGAKAFALIIAVSDVSNLGVTQFGG